MKRAMLIAGLFFFLPASPNMAAEGDIAGGQRAFSACAACHSLEPDRNMTGPSLAGVVNRKAGSLPSFSRYSEAMKRSGLVWNDETLNRYLENPAQFIPDNHMTFSGIPDEKVRADIIAFLKQSGTASAVDQKTAQGQTSGMTGMQRGAPKLKIVDASSRVKAISYCRDTFKVTTEDGKSRNFWERNLRFKTDSSDEGPTKDAPAIVAAGMMGDRASVIFSSPEEIGRFIRQQC